MIRSLLELVDPLFQAATEEMALFNGFEDLFISVVGGETLTALHNLVRKGLG